MRYHLLMPEHNLLMTSTILDLRQIMLEGVVMPRSQYLIQLFQFEFYHIFAGAGFEPATSRL